MRKLLWFVLIIVAVNASDTNEQREERRNQRAAKTAESQAQDDDDTDIEEERRPRRRLYHTSESISKIQPTTGTGNPHIHDVEIGRPIWRAARENICTALNRNGGGLMDLLVDQQSKTDRPILVVDGFGGRKGYDLDMVDTCTVPVRERVYEIIKACLEPDCLWQASLKLYNSMPNSCLTGWIHELDAAYFQVSPEMGLKAQQDFQRIVYLPDYTITSFIILFMTMAAEWEFYLQFLEHNGEPFRLTASAYIAQMRISVTAKTSLFVDLFLAMDDAKQKRRKV